MLSFSTQASIIHAACSVMDRYVLLRAVFDVLSFCAIEAAETPPRDSQRVECEVRNTLYRDSHSVMIRDRASLSLQFSSQLDAAALILVFGLKHCMKLDIYHTVRQMVVLGLGCFPLRLTPSASHALLQRALRKDTAAPQYEALRRDFACSSIRLRCPLLSVRPFSSPIWYWSLIL